MFCRLYFGGLCVFSLLVAGATKCFEEPVSEGQCSRFAYECKLMERLVKLEIEKEILQNKMAEVESKCCVDAKALLKPSPLVAMKARMTSAKTIKNGDRFVYDAIVSNVGDAYDTKTGVFTAPVDGIYSFTVCVCLNPANWMVVAFFRNGGKIGQVLGGDNGYHTCTNDYSTVKLDAFDKVWVEKVRGNTNDLNEDYGWNSFTANLLQSD